MNSTICSLPDELLRYVFGFIKGQYRFVGGTSKHFQRIYKSMFDLTERKNVVEKQSYMGRIQIIKKKRPTNSKVLWNEL